MGSNLLFDILGRRLAHLSDLRSVFLPHKLGMEAAILIANAANGHRPLQGEQPYCLVVSNKAPNFEQVALIENKTQVIQPNQTVKFRKGDRLFIYPENAAALASIDNSTIIGMDSNFPQDAKPPVSLSEISEAILDYLLGLGSIESKTIDREEPTHWINACLSTLIEAHREVAKNDASDWNVLWISHVNLAIENLGVLLLDEIAKHPNGSVGDFFANYTYACFGLARPNQGYFFKNKVSGIGKDIDRAIESWWIDEETASTSIAHLERAHVQASTGEYPRIRDLPWADYDHLIAANDSNLLAFIKMLKSETENIRAMSSFPEHEFFNPVQDEKSGLPLNIWLAESGESCSLGEVGNQVSIHLLKLVGFNDKSNDIKTELVNIDIPTLAEVDAQAISKSALSIEVQSFPKIIWHGQLVSSNGKVSAVGRFHYKATSPKYSELVRKIKVSLKLPAGDVLIGSVDEKSQTEVVFLPDFGPGVLYSELNKSNVPTSFYFVGPDVPNDDQAPYSTVVQNGSSKHLFVALGTELVIANIKAQGSVFDPHVFVFSQQIAPRLSIEIDGTEFFFQAEDKARSIQSPLIAAINRDNLTTEPPSALNSESVRGVLESTYVDLLSNSKWHESLGHIVVTQTEKVDFSKIQGDFHPGLTMSMATHQAWSAVVNFDVAPDFLESQAVKDFIDAFNEVGVLQKLVERSGLPEKPDWPSRTSWRQLWAEERTKLDRYLAAYEELISEAKLTNNPNTIFWASYPFSVSVWDTEQGVCTSVMISPLHPIRLAWLAAAENTLWSAEEAGYLSGTLEGWNFPLLGPSEYANGSFMAIPSDSGDGQLFMGWSYLVSASVSNAVSVSAPTSVAGLPAPGNASSGINASSTKSALKAFRDVNPHVTTLTIDLAANRKTARLQEIDSAILETSTKWSTGEAELLPGGVRIFDSLNREGNPPIEAARAMLSKETSSPISWMRYESLPHAPMRCNIRFLQDSGLKIQIEPQGNSNIGSANLGVVSDTPLRRFEAFSGKTDQARYAFSFPTLSQDNSSNSFNKALRTIENAASRPSIKSHLLNAFLSDESADWTVCGESMISPSGVAGLLRDQNSKGMLWEWRPPIFDKSDDLVLEKRPHLAVARVPKSFRSQVASLLSKAEGVTNIEETQIDSVLSTLGSRGVGLSSLIALGGTHANGALGFHLGLSLIGRLKNDSTDHFVMPLDACEGFLKALANSGKPSARTKKADLLLISLDSTKIVLTPVEIKLYGLTAVTPNSKLPGSADSVLAKAKSQAFESQSLLKQVKDKFEVLRDLSLVSAGSGSARSGDDADYLLWLNGLGSLVEASIKLSGSDNLDSDRLRNSLYSLVTGDLNLEVGKPLVTYFGYQAKTDSGEAFVTEKSDDQQSLESWGLLSANVQETFSAIGSLEDGPILKSWQELVEWATGTLEPQSRLIEDSGSTASKKQSLEEETVAPQSQSIPVVISEIEETLPTSGEKGAESSPAEVEGSEVVVIPENEPEDTAAGSTEEEPKVHLKTSELHESMVWPLSDGLRVVVGEAQGTLGKTKCDFWPGNTALTQMNFGVVGNLGTGKTQFLRSMVFQLRRSANLVQENPLNFLIFDYKKDYLDQDFLDRVGGVALSPDAGIPLNPLAINGEYSKQKAVKRAQAFCDVLAKIYSNVGPVQKDVLTETIVDLFERNDKNRAPSLDEVLVSYKIKSGKSADAVTAILNKFVLPEVFTKDQSKVVSFETLISDKVLIVALSDFAADSDSKNTLVVLLLDLYYEYMLQSKKWDFTGTDPQIRRLNSFLLVDEATNIMAYEFPVLANLLLQGRQYGFGVILASQYLSHFKTQHVNYGETLNSWMVHQVPSVTVAQLSSLGLPSANADSAKRISELKLHEAFYVSLGQKGVWVKGLPYYKLVAS